MNANETTEIVNLLLCVTVLAVAFNTTVLAVLAKYRWIEYYEAHRPRYAPKAVCVLCCSFWFTELYCSVLAVWAHTHGQPYLAVAALLVPFTAAGLSVYTSRTF